MILLEAEKTLGKEKYDYDPSKMETHEKVILVDNLNHDHYWYGFVNKAQLLAFQPLQGSHRHSELIGLWSVPDSVTKVSAK